MSAKQQEKATHKYDLSGWKYAELRDTINMSCGTPLEFKNESDAIVTAVLLFCRH